MGVSVMTMARPAKGFRKTLWEFDEGDDPEEPTTYVGLYPLPGGGIYWNRGRLVGSLNKKTESQM